MRAGQSRDEFELTFERRYYDDQVYDATHLDVGLSCDYPLTIGDDAFNACNTLKYLSLPVRLKSMGTRAFAETTSLIEIVMREDTKHPVPVADRLTTIKSETFTKSNVEEITIPASVTLIESAAFQQTNHLTKITFQHDKSITSEPLVIKEGAFAGGGEADSPDLNVYVNILPEDRLIVCEYNAFTFTQMQGQTRTDGSAKIAKLHFPEEAWDYYQGNWKRGLAFKQENLNAFKDGYTDNTKGYMGIGTSDQIKETAGDTDSGKAVYSGSGEYTPANGWQQFALTSTGIDIFIPAGSFVRTYSTKKPQVIPTFALLENKPDGVNSSDPMFKIYRISQFNDNYIGGVSVTPSIRPVATATEINVKVSSRMYIPDNTGVIMVGTSTTATVLVYLSDIDIVSPKRYQYTPTQPNNDIEDEVQVDNTNLLWPSCVDDGIEAGITSKVTVDGTERVILNPTYPYPYYGAQPDFRFFALAKNSSNEYYFSRFKKGGFVTRDKAYLRLSKDIFHWSNEGETASGTGTGLAEPGSTQAPIMLSFMDPEGNTTDVRMINLETMTIMDDCYYTLQGVKISGHPTQQGIYIHNGKKVVIK